MKVDVCCIYGYLYTVFYQARVDPGKKSRSLTDEEVSVMSSSRHHLWFSWHTFSSSPYYA